MIVYGKQVVFYILEKHPKIIQQIFLTKEIDKKLFNKFMNTGAKIIRPDEQKAQSLARGGNHQGFLLDIGEFNFEEINEIKKNYDGEIYRAGNDFAENIKNCCV